MAKKETHILIDNLVEQLRVELLTKLRSDIDGALKQRDRTLKSMVREMLAEHKAQMLQEVMDKVDEEVHNYTACTDDAMSCFMGEIRSQIKKEVQREVSIQLQGNVPNNKQEEDDNSKEEEKKENRDTCRVTWEIPETQETEGHKSISLLTMETQEIPETEELQETNQIPETQEIPYNLLEEDTDGV